VNNDLLMNLNKIHSAELGIERIKRNLNINPDNIIEWCRERIEKADNISRSGKNWYVHVDDFIFTVNASSFTIIAVHNRKIKK